MNDVLNNNILSYVFNCMDDAVCITQKNGVLQYFNPSAADLFGISEDSIGTDKIWEKIPFIKRNDSLIQLFLDAITEKAETQKAIVDYVNNGKKKYKLWVSITFTEENDGNFVIVINDVTKLFKVNEAFERYTSPQIADYVLNTPKGEKKGGHSKEITILMSDLRGFTTLSSVLSPEELIKALNHYFEKMVAVIEKYGGTVIEFLGDGIFVVFGAPHDDPDHASHAVECAVEMQNANAADSEWYHQRGIPELEMGIGINSGSAIAGNIGSKQKMKYGVMGYAVNLTGRIESLTIGGQILISENTKDMIEEDVHIKAKQNLLLKGAGEYITVYDVIGIGKCSLASTSSQDTSWIRTKQKKAISFYLLDGKLVSETSHSGYIIAVSENRHFALLSSEYPLKQNNNIMFDEAINIYAKVIGANKEAYIISFTSRTDEVLEWIDKLTE